MLELVGPLREDSLLILINLSASPAGGIYSRLLSAPLVLFFPDTRLQVPCFASACVPSGRQGRHENSRCFPMDSQGLRRPRTEE